MDGVDSLYHLHLDLVGFPTVYPHFTLAKVLPWYFLLHLYTTWCWSVVMARVHNHMHNVCPSSMSSRSDDRSKPNA